MGCVSSKSIDNEERVQRCKERRRLMKQLVVVRGEFAVSQMAYLHALKNTGVTLRQFAESESSVLDFDEMISTSFDDDDDDELIPLPSSPLPPLPPPPPPPPPPFSPNRRDDDCVEEVIDEDGGGSDCTSPPVSGSSWNFWDPFDPLSSSSPKKKREVVGEKVEEEEWAETKTEFEEEEEEEEGEEEVVVVEENENENENENEEEEEEEKVGGGDIVLISLPEKPLVVDFHDENSSVASTADMAMVVRTRRRKNTLLGILKEIDDYFLKAYDSGREVAILLDSNRGDSIHQNLEDSMRKSFKSAKVFSALSWSWSSKSLQSTKDTVECHDSSEPCNPGAHCVTLDKLNTEEERLYKEVKEEEMAKLEYDRKIFLLQKQDVGEQDSIKTEEARFNIESLESSIISLQDSISKTCLSILKLRDEELHPQLLELSSRLTRMWRTMYECHQVQNHIAQQVSHLSNNPSTEPTSDYHRQSAVQLETEVNVWYNCFCNLLRSQREYVRVLSRWVLLAEGLVDDQQHIGFTSNIHILCEEWQLALDRLPEKVAAEAIKSFVSIIHSIVLQQTEERILHKKSDRLERRLQKELNTLSDMEKKFDGNLTAEGVSSLSPNHPLVVKRARIEAFRKKVDDEKAKYLHSVQVSRAMTLDNLQTSLPNVFQALTGFSSFCAQTFEAVHGLTQSTVCLEEESQPST